jgi:translation initiation factor 1 (eIF-1/SUI1)
MPNIPIIKKGKRKMINDKEVLNTLQSVDKELKDIKEYIIETKEALLLKTHSRARELKKEGYSGYKLLEEFYGKATARLVMEDEISALLGWYLRYDLDEFEHSSEKWIGKFRLPNLPCKRLSYLNFRHTLLDYDFCDHYEYYPYCDEEEVQKLLDSLKDSTFLGLYMGCCDSYCYLFETNKEHSLIRINVENRKKGKMIYSVECYDNDMKGDDEILSMIEDEDGQDD